MRRTRPSFSLIELLASAVILSILAVMGVPYAQTAKDRQVELELKEALLKVRLALDSYSYNEHPKGTSIDGDVIMGEDGCGDPDGDGIADDDWDGTIDEDGAPLFPQRLQDLTTKGYLTGIPRDPLSADPTAPSTWTLSFVERKFMVANPDGSMSETRLKGIVDIRSKNGGTGLSGTRFNSW